MAQEMPYLRRVLEAGMRGQFILQATERAA